MAKQKHTYKGARPKATTASQASNEQIAAAIEVAETGGPPPVVNTAWDEGVEHEVSNAVAGPASEGGEASPTASEAGEAPAAGVSAAPAPPASPAALPAVGDDRPATIEELEAACEDAPAEFLVELLKARVPMGVAHASWLARRRTLEEAAAKLEETHGGTVIALQFPMARVNLHHPGGYQSKVKQHVELQLRGDEKRAVLWIKNGLENARAKLNSGRYVSTYTDALRWMIEQATREFLLAEHVTACAKAAANAKAAAS